MIRRVVRIAFMAAVLAVAFGISVAYGGISDIFGSSHDLGSPGSPTCSQCHIPHNAQAPYLWARAPKTDMSGLQALCFSCHDGSVTPVGQWIPSYANHPLNPGAAGQDCDRCHDPHEGDNWKFASGALAASFRNANLCNSCHSGWIGSITHPTDVLTNLPIDRTWDPYASPPDFSGTRLFNEAGDAVVPSGDGYIKCATCHAPHGGVPGTKLNSMAYRKSDSSRSPICGNCHR